jgi:DNA-binding NtrC family response regulator
MVLKTILVVDDEKDLRNIYEQFLKRAGYNVITADNPVEALKTVDTQTIGLVITDYRMPKLDGANFCELIKERHPTLPLIMISGYTNEAIETFRACQYGPDVIIDKPVQRSDLLAAVAKYLERAA